MKKYLISLAKDVNRRELFFSQSDTADFQLFDAINTMQTDWELLNTQFNLTYFVAARKIYSLINQTTWRTHLDLRMRNK